MQTPASSRYARALSPPLSTSSQAFTIGQQQKLNVVTRLAIEGKATQGDNGAAIKIYLKARMLMGFSKLKLNFICALDVITDGQCHPWVDNPSFSRCVESYRAHLFTDVVPLQRKMSKF
jgi:hypothetical protein